MNHRISLYCAASCNETWRSSSQKFDKFEAEVLPSQVFTDCKSYIFTSCYLLTLTIQRTLQAYVKIHYVRLENSIQLGLFHDRIGITDLAYLLMTQLLEVIMTTLEHLILVQASRVIITILHIPTKLPYSFHRLGMKG